MLKVLLDGEVINKVEYGYSYLDVGVLLMHYDNQNQIIADIVLYMILMDKLEKVIIDNIDDIWTNRFEFILKLDICENEPKSGPCKTISKQLYDLTVLDKNTNKDKIIKEYGNNINNNKSTEIINLLNKLPNSDAVSNYLNKIKK